jgi:hypothetical protein
MYVGAYSPTYIVFRFSSEEKNLSSYFEETNSVNHKIFKGSPKTRVIY